MKHQTITPHEILSPGTRVRMKTYEGVVLSHYVAPNGVVVHKIHLTIQKKKGNWNVWKNYPYNKIIEPNYSFVSVIKD